MMNIYLYIYSLIKYFSFNILIHIYFAFLEKNEEKKLIEIMKYFFIYLTNKDIKSVNFSTRTMEITGYQVRHSFISFTV